MELYHGTKNAATGKQIEANGLTSERYSHYNRVLTSRKDEAGYFAGAKGAVVTVRVPKSRAAEYLDEAPQGAGQLASLRKPLPKSMIHKVEYVASRSGWDPGKHPRVLHGKGGGEFAHVAGVGAETGEVTGGVRVDAGVAKTVQAFTDRTAGAVPGLLGGGTESWNGTLNIQPDLGGRGGGTVLAEMPWTGGMNMLGSVAQSISDTLRSGGPVGLDDADSFVVPLHELIHGDIGGKSAGEVAAATAAHARSGRSMDDDAILGRLRSLDAARADGGPGEGGTAGAYRPSDIAGHDWINKVQERAALKATKAAIADLVKRGFLEPTGTSSSIGGGPMERNYRRTAKAMATDPPSPLAGQEQFASGGSAYQNPNTQAIEEGFTELGTVQHAPEFFDHLGIGGRTTVLLNPGPDPAHPHAVDNPDWQRRASGLKGRFSVESSKISGQAYGPPQEGRVASTATLEDLSRAMARAANDIDAYDLDGAAEEIGRLERSGDPVLLADAASLREDLGKLQITPQSKHLTLTEYARSLQDPVRIKSGDAWHHYSHETAMALEWAQTIASAEGLHGDALAKRVRELSDEINREGTARKLDVMAGQVQRVLTGMAAKLPPAGRKFLGSLRGRPEDAQAAIRDHWLMDGPGAAFDAAKEAWRGG